MFTAVTVCHTNNTICRISYSEERTRYRWEDNIKMEIRVLAGSIQHRIGSSGSAVQCSSDSNEALCSIKCTEFLHQLSDCHLKQDFVLWS
jgi:hypothetical protein